MLRQLAGQQETNGGLNFPAADGRALVVVGKSGRLRSDALVDVVDERIHDAHRLAGNSSVGMHLLQDLVNVDAEAFLPSCTPLLLLVGRRSLLNRFFASFRRSHVNKSLVEYAGKNEV